MPRLEDHLVLNRYLHHLLGVDSFEELKGLLQAEPEGLADDGHSYFFGRLVSQPRRKIDRQRLAEYDSRVLGYEDRLRRARREFRSWRYFQYLALLYSEIWLDDLTANPVELLGRVNAFLSDLRVQEPDLHAFPNFDMESLQRMAFFMATGSGKTLLMHVNVWQVLHYLAHGRHPEPLVRRSDGRRVFDNILLITPPHATLSEQHVKELRASGLRAELFIDTRDEPVSMFEPMVKVIEISKLAEEASGEGLSVPLDQIGPRNLVLVDEGHKGTGTEAKTWKRRQKALSADGYLLEYSATFAQAIGAAGAGAQETLLGEYGRAISFDYSYPHFYGDGYGKDFRVLNLARAAVQRAHELLVGGLLTYYHQVWLFERDRVGCSRHNLEKPLWVLLGSSVNAMYTLDQERRSDVAEVVFFLQRFLEDPGWAIATIERILNRTSGFEDATNGGDLFAPHIEHLLGMSPQDLYDRIRHRVFHGTGALEIRELKQAEGELGLRASTGTVEESAYFGVINIGDVPAFKTYLEEQLSIHVEEDRVTTSQFSLVERVDSPINVLIGAKKFIEGWSCWRVSSMGLLNVGRGQGPQVIQLFGRGVRLKGEAMSLKRTILPVGQTPDVVGLRHLETLYIFGWNADYIRLFRETLEREDVGQEFPLRVRLEEPWPQDKLPVPQTQAGFDVGALTWTLAADGPVVSLDLTPKLAVLSGAEGGPQVLAGRAGRPMQLDFSQPGYADLLDWGNLYQQMLTYKQSHGYGNLFVPRNALPDLLRRRCLVYVEEADSRDPERVQAAAAQVLRKYMDRYVRQRERQAESEHVEVGLLEPERQVLREYRIQVRPGAFLDQIEALLRQTLEARDSDEPLPRLYVDWSLFNPVLVEGGAAWRKAVSVRPPALKLKERQLMADLKSFWRDNHRRAPFADYEVFLLRNMPKAGIGLFHRSGFYPDFIVWIRRQDSGAIHMRFIDPHGLHHDGLEGSKDKFEALRALQVLSELSTFKEKHISLDGFILAFTPLNEIPDVGERTRGQLEAEFPLMWQEGNYGERLLTFPGDGH